MSEHTHFEQSDYFDLQDSAPGAANQIQTAADAQRPYGRGVGDAGAAGAARRVTPTRLWEQKWTVLVVFLVVALPGAAAAWLMHKPVYEARGALYIEPTKPTIAYKDADNQIFHNYRQYRNDQAANLRSPAVLNRVLDNERVRSTGWFKEESRFAGGGATSRLERLRDELDVTTPRDSSFVYLSMRCRDSSEAALIVNTALRECVEYVAHEYDSDEEIILSLQEKNAEKLELDVRMLKTDIADLLESSGLYSENPQVLVQQKALRIDTKRADLNELARELQLVRHRMERRRATQSAEPDERSPDAALAEKTFTPRAADPVWRRMNESVAEAEFALEVGGRRMGESHPDLIALRTAADNMRKRLSDYEKEMEGMTPAGNHALAGGVASPGAEGEYASDIEYQIAELQTEIEAEIKDLKTTTARVRELEERQEELRRVNERLALYRQRTYARKAERQAPPWIKERPAVEPSQSVNAKQRYAFLALAVLFGAGLGLMTAYWRTSTNPAIYSIAEVLDPAETTFLGYLPRVRNPKALSLMEENVQAEHIRMIRTALLERTAQGDASAVLITSAGAGAGKTTVAWRLALSLAQCNKRVLLIDADLRNPSLSERYAETTGPGLVGLLRGEATDADAIRPSETEGLYVLPSGQARGTPNPELLAGEALQAALQRWRAEYDIVVLDTTPVIPVADARILARLTDGAVLVLRADHCRRDEIFEAMAALNASGTRLLGTVFVGEGRRTYYGDYYSNYYQLACAGEAASCES